MDRRFLPSLVLIVAAACSSGAPTETERSVARGPTLDGGVMHGSGNRSDSTATNTTAGTSGEATAVEKENSGVMHGSGN
jgi:hypothetical protein